jgi:signal transduction histidine kinase
MPLPLRHRIALTVVPLLALIAVLGAAGLVLLHRLGGRIDVILKENYDSVVAMVRLNDALERIDSEFQFALAGRHNPAAYEKYWSEYDRGLQAEQANVTLPGEQERVDRLVELTRLYQSEGARFLAADPPRAGDYFGTPGAPGLLGRFDQIKTEADAIRQMNQDNMIAASADAKRTARASRTWFAAGLVAAAAVALLLAWQTTRTILRPVRALTESAQNVAAGNLNQVVLVSSRDELGRLAESFNRMTEQLRSYRQSTSARLVRAQRTSQAAIDAFPDPVIVVDSAGRVEMANPVASRVLGAAAADGAAPWQPPDSLRGPLADALSGERAYLPESFEQTLPFHFEGTERIFLPRILPIRTAEGDPLGAAVVLNDVTRFRLMDRMKSDLIATVSHELKTPLTSVRLVVHLLLEEAVGPLSPKQTELLIDARDNAERLLKTIDQLLALARLEQRPGELTRCPKPPEDLLREAAEAVAPRAEAKHVAVALDLAPGLPPVAADTARLGLALDNLINNALTYTDAGGRITLTSAADSPGRVRLTVADTGVGIPPEHLAHVFEKFFRIPNQTREGSTGLGLSIVREIVTAHRGDITCESAAGKGTAFHIYLPVWEGSS